MEWLNENSRLFLKRGYLVGGQTPEERIHAIAEKAEDILGIEGFANKFYEYMSRGFYSLASPVWANFGTNRGLPISCYGSNIEDNMADILYTQAEVGMMSKHGGGTSGYFGHLRPRGAEITNNGQSSGAVHFMELFEAMTDVVSQGSTRRGRFSPYLPIEHGDIDEFLRIGSEGNPIQGLTHGVTVTDEWMKSMIAGNEAKRATWAKVLQSRVEIGYPYLFFTDTVNEGKPQVYKDKDLKINHSNLCSEIALPSNEEWSFVCNLSSMNAAKYEEWKDTDAVETMVFFLDAVMQEFIDKLEMMKNSEEREERASYIFMEKAHKFAKENRAIGLGVLGWHSFLQEKMIPFDSVEADAYNVDIFSTIDIRANKASQQLAEMFGEPKVLKGYGRRNATLTAIAPTTSSSFILGQVSQSIEPLFSNIYVKDLDKSKITVKNRKLTEILKEKGKNTREVWNDIRNHDGSVQHVDFLTEHEKEVFKTFSEIDQMAIINQAARRQDFIDQSQSLNIMVNPTIKVKDINELHITAWEKGVKTLYYQHSTNAAQQFNQRKVCEACEA